FGEAGKEGITIADVLAHRSGAPVIDEGITVEQLTDWTWMTEMIARQEPVAPPDTINAYSPFAFGWVIGELVRRTDPSSRSFADFVRDEVLAPVGMDAFHLGVPQDQLSRVASLTGEEPPVPSPGSLVARSSPAHLPLGPSLFNSEAIRTAVLPSFGGISTSRSVARLLAVYARGGLLEGEPFLTAETIEYCRTPRPPDVDQTYGVVMPVGKGALWLVAPAISASGPITTGILSHTAAGGTFAWAEPDTGLAVSICHNRMFFAPRQPMPWAALGDAIHAVVDDLR
ncbi:MAG: serine hydrolase domain-containing protein, partial [Jiangellaceae bacterium]